MKQAQNAMLEILFTPSVVERVSKKWVNETKEILTPRKTQPNVLSDIIRNYETIRLSTGRIILSQTENESWLTNKLMNVFTNSSLTPIVNLHLSYIKNGKCVGCAHCIEHKNYDHLARKTTEELLPEYILSVFLKIYFDELKATIEKNDFLKNSINHESIVLIMDELSNFYFTEIKKGA